MFSILKYVRKHRDQALLKAGSETPNVFTAPRQIGKKHSATLKSWIMDFYLELYNVPWRYLLSRGSFVRLLKGDRPHKALLVVLVKFPLQGTPLLESSTV